MAKYFPFYAVKHTAAAKNTSKPLLMEREEESEELF
jgi:hypothetical protein